MTEERLNSIETKIAYQELTVSELNEVVIEQQKTIDRMDKQLKELTDKLNDIAELTGSDRGGIQKPPHY